MFAFGMNRINRRALRWTLFTLAIVCLAASFVVDGKLWTSAGFFVCGGAWFWLAKRKARELDAPRPR